MTGKSKAFATAALVFAAALPALAADPVTRPVSAPAMSALAPSFSFTGFYVGTLSGYAFSDRQEIRTVGNNGGAPGLTNTMLNVSQGRRPASISGSQDGFTSFGGGGGYDFQFMPGSGVVVGVAADDTLMDLGRRRGYVGPALAANGFVPDVSGYRQTLDTLGTVRGRLGYAFDRFLVYGTGGFAFGDVFYRAAFLRSPDLALSYLGRYSGTETGYAYGGGVEYAIPVDSFLNKFSLASYVPFLRSDAVTLKAEYLHYDLGSRNVLVSPQIAGGPNGSYTARFKTEGDLVRGGFAYRFNGF